MDLVRDSKLQGIEIERSGFRLKIDGRRPASAGSAGVLPSAMAPLEVLSDSSTSMAVDNVNARPAQEIHVPAPETVGHQLKSPIVGTFYSAPSPDMDPYTTVGQIVKKGQVLCIIEAMKLMNEIEADVGGEGLAVYPENAQPVEFGEPLFLIRTSS